MKRIKEIINEIAETISKEYHIIGSSMEKTIKKMNIKIIKTTFFKNKKKCYTINKRRWDDYEK